MTGCRGRLRRRQADSSQSSPANHHPHYWNGSHRREPARLHGETRGTQRHQRHSVRRPMPSRRQADRHTPMQRTETLRHTLRRAQVRRCIVRNGSSAKSFVLIPCDRAYGAYRRPPHHNRLSGLVAFGKRPVHLQRHSAASAFPRSRDPIFRAICRGVRAIPRNNAHGNARL